MPGMADVLSLIRRAGRPLRLDTGMPNQYRLEHPDWLRSCRGSASAQNDRSIVIADCRTISTNALRYNDLRNPSFVRPAQQATCFENCFRNEPSFRESLI